MGQTIGVSRNGQLVHRDTTESPNRGTSPWETLSPLALHDPGAGRWWRSDFEDNPSSKTLDHYQIVKGTGASVAKDTTLAGSWMKIPTAASSNDYQLFASQTSNLKPTSRTVWEYCVNVTEANTNKAAWCVGQTSVITSGFLVDTTGAPPSSFSGAMFYKSASAMTLGFITSNATVQNIVSLGTIVSGQTYILGCSIDPNDGVTAKATYYLSTVVAGVRTFVASGTVDLTLGSIAATYEIIGLKAASSSAETISVEWAQVYQGRIYV